MTCASIEETYNRKTNRKITDDQSIVTSIRERCLHQTLPDAEIFPVRRVTWNIQTIEKRKQVQFNNTTDDTIPAVVERRVGDANRQRLFERIAVRGRAKKTKPKTKTIKITII